MLLRARIVLPVTAPPIEDGAVSVCGGRIREVGRWRDLREREAGRALDLGEVALFPGLVNAHCHLDFTDLAGVIPRPRSFSDWIKSILTARSAWTFSDYAASWLRGARQLLATGTTTVANVESVPEMVADVVGCTPVRVHSFLELTGIRSGRTPAELVRRAEDWVAAQPPRRGGFGLSPHAPYSTLPELYGIAGRSAVRHGWRVMTHVAESQEEFEMFMYRRGRLFDWLAPQRDPSDCGSGSPVGHLERHGAFSAPVLAVHANYLWHDDASRLARARATVVHCPRSHRYFGHRRFPLEELRAAGVPVAVGTDSLASTLAPPGDPPLLSMLRELAAMGQSDSTLSPDDLLDLGTRAGAHALGLAGLAGELCEGAWADLAWIAHAGPAGSASDAVVHHPGELAGVMISGIREWPRPDAVSPRSGCP